MAHGVTFRNVETAKDKGLKSIEEILDPGRFGIMFPSLPEFHPDRDRLEQVALGMIDPAIGPGADGQPHEDPEGDNPDIPSGFTYLGQFIDHDITLDLTSLSEQIEDPRQTVNFRTPGLDLDSVYGRGPGGSPHLYDRLSGFTKLLVGTAEASPFPNGGIPAIDGGDLPRGPQGTALIGDHRNDENLLVAQTHVAFLHFHNAMVDRLAGTVPDGELFDAARKEVVWHYQWMVLNDFVARLAGPELINRILDDGRKLYRFPRHPFMPTEFAGAVYRLGHSMVRQIYSHNRVFTAEAGRPATFDLLFHFSALSGHIVGQLGNKIPSVDPGNFASLPSNWVIDWKRFYQFDTPNPDGIPINQSRRLDCRLVHELAVLRGFPGGREQNLAFRNLARGSKLGLPTGQNVALLVRMHYPEVQPLTTAEIISGHAGAAIHDAGLAEETPLWFYILKEAEIRENGQRLGPIGARILAEVFIGLLQGGTLEKEGNMSFLSDPGWRPSIGPDANTFRMVDLLTFADVVDQIDKVVPKT
ncbi:hypothetical protein ABB55_23640 [Prosthecomicrobium hirschii]|uniref:Heme peroxidase n=1 Tax=Prosthecodimorpha hirschii TaxID=665126 RepID=A0A0P6WEH7_9HYPH|nr:heme peroxidase family protein [Prosthecomicrobium hirschii]KPL54844.1 hypothetical protein ABB55_23640 [Prosthecomicrobium hirschii]